MLGVGPRLPGPLARVFDRAQCGREVARQLVSAQRGSGVREVGDGLFCCPEERPLAGQLRFLVGARIQCIEVGEVLFQLFPMSRRLCGGCPEIGHGAFGGLEPVGGGGDPGQLRLQPAIVVQQGAVGLPVQEADGLMLAVHLDQSLTDLPQRRNARGLIVDKGPAAAVRGQGAAQDQLLARDDLESARRDHLDQVRVVGGREDGGGRRLFRAASHQAGIGARAKGQAQGVENDRLARPGLAGQHRQAGVDVEVEHVHQHDVADGEGGQHEGAVVRI